MLMMAHGTAMRTAFPAPRETGRGGPSEASAREGAVQANSALPKVPFPALISMRYDPGGGGREDSGCCPGPSNILQCSLPDCLPAGRSHAFASQRDDRWHSQHIVCP